MTTFGPPESSQDETKNWTDLQIKKLGSLIAKIHQKVLTQAKCKNISYSDAKRIPVGKLESIYFDLNFTNIKGKKRIGEKYYIYTKNNTVILTMEYPTELLSNSKFQEIKKKIVNSLIIR